MSRRRRAVSDARFALSMAVIGVVVIGLGIGFAGELSSSQGAVQKAIQSVQAQEQTVQQTVTASQAPSGGVYPLTIVITSNDQWNSSTTAPRFWVVTPNGMVSAANLTLPAHRLIQLTVEDFDSSTPVPSQYAQVQGTVGNTMMLMNVTATAGNPTNATNYSVVSSLDAQTQVSHTFSIPQLGINIPSAPNSIEVADFTINQTGSFVWHCEDPCGFGPTGWEGPMNAPGWMWGTVNVS